MILEGALTSFTFLTHIAAFGSPTIIDATNQVTQRIFNTNNNYTCTVLVCHLLWEKNIIGRF